MPFPHALRAPALLLGLALSALLASAQTAPLVPTELRAQKLEMRSTDTETTAIATGDVILTGTNLRITCDQLTLVAIRLGDKDATIGTADKFKYILATGKVRIVQGDREATCERAEVFPREDKVVLSEGPVIIDHSSGITATGEPLILLRGERAVQGTNVKVTARPIEDLGATAAPRGPASSR
jgi:lipopolysaccharide export system protein LptA